MKNIILLLLSFIGTCISTSGEFWDVYRPTALILSGLLYASSCYYAVKLIKIIVYKLN